MLLFTISLNLFIVLVMFGLALWGVYVLIFVGGRRQTKTKRPTPTSYTFFQPTAPNGGGTTFSGTVPLSNVNTDELRFGMVDIGTTNSAVTPPLSSQTSAIGSVKEIDAIPDDNPDFALVPDEFGDDPASNTDTLAKTRQIIIVQATPAPVSSPSPTPAIDLNQLTRLDEDVLNQVEAIFGNVDQMELLDHYHSEANRVMLLTREDYHTVFLRLIQDESAESQAYLTSMLVPAGTPEYVTSLATVLAMGDEEAVDD